MIPDRLIDLAAAIALAAALTGQLPRLIYEVRVAELRLLKESAPSHWGDPSIFGKQGRFR